MQKIQVQNQDIDQEQEGSALQKIKATQIQQQDDLTNYQRLIIARNWHKHRLEQVFDEIISLKYDLQQQNIKYESEEQIEFQYLLKKSTLQQSIKLIKEQNLRISRNKLMGYQQYKNILKFIKLNQNNQIKRIQKEHEKNIRLYRNKRMNQIYQEYSILYKNTQLTPNQNNQINLSIEQKLKQIINWTQIQRGLRNQKIKKEMKQKQQQQLAQEYDQLNKLKVQQFQLQQSLKNLSNQIQKKELNTKIFALSLRIEQKIKKLTTIQQRIQQKNRQIEQQKQRNNNLNQKLNESTNFEDYFKKSLVQIQMDKIQAEIKQKEQICNKNKQKANEYRQQDQSRLKICFKLGIDMRAAKNMDIQGTRFFVGRDITKQKQKQLRQIDIFIQKRLKKANQIKNNKQYLQKLKQSYNQIKSQLDELNEKLQKQPQNQFFLKKKIMLNQGATDLKIDDYENYEFLNDYTPKERKASEQYELSHYVI